MTSLTDKKTSAGKINKQKATTQAIKDMEDVPRPRLEQHDAISI